MLSYLHGVRPGNRRQAAAPPPSNPIHLPPPAHPPNLLNDQSIDSRIPAAGSARPVSGGPSTSAFSSDPPLQLPPIPRVSSRRNSEIVQNESSLVQNLNNAITTGEGDDIAHQQSGQCGPDLPQPEVAMSGSKGKMHEAPPGKPEESSAKRRSPEAFRSSGRPKRPIDLAFDNMRAYTEPPFRQSIMMPLPDNHQPARPYQYPPPPLTPPTPPPKSSQMFLRGSSKGRDPPKPSRNPPPPPHSQRPNDPSVHYQQLALTGEAQQQSQPGKHTQGQVPVQDGNPPMSKHGKARLTLRNPLTLLGRRRSSQALHDANNTQVKSTPAVPLRDDFDPSIRGKRIHDFNAPRLGRPHTAGGSASKSVLDPGGNRSNSNIPPLPRPSSATDNARPVSRERDHTPVFKEHFDDGGGVEKDGPTMKKSEAFMNAMSKPDLQVQPDPASLPAFARNLPSTVVAGDINNIHKSPTPSFQGPLEAVPETLGLQQSSHPSPPHSTPSTHSRSTSVNDQSLSGIGSPRRFKSNASRFSFDLAGVGSAVQEKLLEDRHRQKQEQQKRQSLANNTDVYDEDDFSNYDDMDDPGLEEKIPGVNVDGDDDDETDAFQPLAQQTLDSANDSFISPNKSSFESAPSAGSTGLTSLATPRELGNQATSSIVPKPVRAQAPAQASDLEPSAENQKALRPRSTPGDKTDPQLHAPKFQRVISSDSNLAGLPKRQTYHDDELYFDDGMIEDVGDDGSSQEFDESVFDDNSHELYGLPLRDRTLKPLDGPEQLETSEVPRESGLAQTIDTGVDHESALPSSANSESLLAEQRDAVPELSKPMAPGFNQSAGLTYDNLAAYNSNDLVRGVHEASQKGAFDRAQSVSTYSEPDALPEMARENNRSSGLMFELSGIREDDDTADSDDDIVAAANAEALENDDDGFYGQEFGFYAQGSGEAQYSNGGYFGKAPEGVHRSHSGRAEFQEPSLTPITERSEWSNRNSTISLAMHGYPLSGSAFPSEHQLSNMMNLPEENMTLEGLMKLRRSAWGGSHVSLHSSSNSQNSGSPLTNLPAGGTPPIGSQGSQANVYTHGSSSNLALPSHSLNNSSNNVAGLGQASSSTDSDGSPSAADSPTVTLSSPFQFPIPPSTTSSAPMPIIQPFPAPPSMPPPPVPTAPPPSVLATSLPSHTTAETSSISRSNHTIKGTRKSWAAPGASGHTRSTSGGAASGSRTLSTSAGSEGGRGGWGTESVSYKEEGGKWVLERRRTGDAGEIEVVGRSVVEKGRI